MDVDAASPEGLSVLRTDRWGERFVSAADHLGQSESTPSLPRARWPSREHGGFVRREAKLRREETDELATGARDLFSRSFANMRGKRSPCCASPREFKDAIIVGC